MSTHDEEAIVAVQAHERESHADGDLPRAHSALKGEGSEGIAGQGETGIPHLEGSQAIFPVCEIFRSLSGETTRAGEPATFLRLSGCNLRCRYCDTEYAHGPGTPMTLQEVLEAVEARSAADLVVVTGGEPLLVPAVPRLLVALCDLGRTVLLETNGSLDIKRVDPRVCRIVDVKCPGSGESGHNRWENLDVLLPHDEVKLVISDRADFDFALHVVRRHHLLARCTVLVSPAHGVLSPALLADWILDSGLPLRLQLQLHRLIWPDIKRGV